MSSPLPHSPMAYSQKWWLLSQRRNKCPAPGMLSHGALPPEESELLTRHRLQPEGLESPETQLERADKGCGRYAGPAFNSMSNAAF